MDIVTLALAKKYARQVGSTITSITATDTGIHFVTSTGEFDVNLDGWTGSKDYIDLINKPSINSTELVGNKTLTELGISQVGQTGNYNDLTNKPTIPTKTSELQNDSGFIKAGDIPNIPTKTSDLQNDSGFITKTVSDLVNYYNKTETFTKQEVQDLIRTVSGLQMQVVDQLPVESIDTNTIYLLKVEGTNSYEQWIYSSNQWFKLGTTDVSLVDYYTKTQIDEKFVQKEIGKTLSSNDFTNADKTKLDSVETGANNYTLPIATDNILGGVKIGKNLSISTDGKLNAEITGGNGTVVTVEGIAQETWNADTKANVSDIPTKISQLENDSNYAVKSEIPTQTSQLNNDSGFITDANIPTKTSELINDSGFISSIPQATTNLGGIRANPKQDSDTTEVRIDGNTGYLYCSGGAGGGGNLDSKQDKPTTNNTAYGLNSLLNITTGEGNTSIGYKALSKITQGSSNVAIGNTTMELATGNNNIGIGRLALNLIQGNGNVAIGNYALQNSISASDNIGLGSSSLFSNINGNNNVALGIYSMQFNKDGSNNTAIGQNSLKFKIDGSNNTGSNNCTGVGFGASISGDNQVQLGDSNTTTYCYGAIQNRSDKRDKADIQETKLGLNFISKLRPSQFKWNYRDDYKGEENDGSKKRNRYHQGFIAQEVKAVMDELGVDFGGYQDHSINGGCDVLSLGYEEFIAPIVKAIQEQQQMIDKQQELIQSLEDRIGKLEQK